MNRKSKIIVSVVGISIVLLALLGITYAYYLTRIQGNTNTNSISVTTADLKLVYGDGNGLVTANDIMPGTTITKTFTVTNDGESKVENYVVVLESIVNTLTRTQDLTYKLECKLENETSCGKTQELVFPSGVTEKAIFLNSIDKDVTHYYTLVVTYENLTDTDQSDDMGSSISALVNIKDKSQIDTTGLINPSVSMTLKEALLAAYGGENKITEIDPDDKKDRIVGSSGIYINDKEYYWGTSYSVDAEGNYKLAGTIVKSTPNDCINGTNTCGNYTIENTTSETATSTHIIEVTDFKTDGSYIDAIERMYSKTFQAPVTASDSGMYKTQDDYGTSYYYRGNVTNNYVKFGKYSEEVRGYFSASNSASRTYKTMDECTSATYFNYNCTDMTGKNMYWRIVRINGDGTIRMIYAGTSKLGNGESGDSIIGYEDYNTAYEDKMYVGYMYGTADDPYGDNPETTLTDSTVKVKIDNWYNTHLKTNYGKFIADSIFCNDREESYTDTNGDIYYKPYDRVTNGTPSLVCNNIRDSFTMKDTKLGNGHLNNPVGLLTVDEAVMAGDADYGSGTDSNYLGNRNTNWTSSPGRFSETGWVANVFLEEYGGVYDNYVSSDYSGFIDYAGVRPVINLKADVEFTIDEDGTYVITIN